VLKAYRLQIFPNQTFSPVQSSISIMTISIKYLTVEQFSAIPFVPTCASCLLHCPSVFQVDLAFLSAFRRSVVHSAQYVLDKVDGNEDQSRVVRIRHNYSVAMDGVQVESYSVGHNRCDSARYSVD